MMKSKNKINKNKNKNKKKISTYVNFSNLWLKLLDWKHLIYKNYEVQFSAQSNVKW
jgi:hypothetical protein